MEDDRQGHRISRRFGWCYWGREVVGIFCLSTESVYILFVLVLSRDIRYRFICVYVDELFSYGPLVPPDLPCQVGVSFVSLFSFSVILS